MTQHQRKGPREMYKANAAMEVCVDICIPMCIYELLHTVFYLEVYLSVWGSGINLTSRDYSG